MTSLPSALAPVPSGVPMVGGRNPGLVGTDGRPMPPITAYDGQDPVEYAKTVAEMGSDGSTAAHRDPSQWPNQYYQTFPDSHRIRDTRNPNHLIFGVSLPLSVQHGRHYAERGNHRHQPQYLVSVHPHSAEVTTDERAQTLAGLSELAKWLRLQNAVLPEPLVGEHDVDPAGLIDQLGVKGLSAYSAFVDIEDLRCRICTQDSNTIDAAIHHQRHKRHLQA